MLDAQANNADNVAVLDGNRPQIRAAVRDDVRLVRRCLEDDSSAWEELFERCHLQLRRSIRFLLGTRAGDNDTVEEIAARVWYALVREDRELLRRFDGERNTPLVVYIFAIARYETLMLLRSERRRKNREATKVRLYPNLGRLSEGQMQALLSDFVTTLTQGERQFLECSLLASPEGTDNPLGLTDTTVWERRSRIRKKVKAFFR